MSAKPSTKAHEQSSILRQDVWYPEHVQRTESAEFARNKHQLIHKLRLGCWVCGSREKLEVHHWAVEWALWPSVDPKVVLAVTHSLDPYGFAMKEPEPPLESPDDLRNLLVLCEVHHRAPYFGVHMITWPIWIAQREAKPGVKVTVDPILKKAA